MKSTRHDLILRLFKFFYIVFAVLPFGAVWSLIYVEKMELPYYTKGNVAISILFIILYATFGKVFNAFLVSLPPLTETIYSQALTFIMTDGLMYGVMVLLIKRFPNVWPLFIVFLIQLALVALWSVVIKLCYFKIFPPKKTAVIFDMRRGLEKSFKEYGLDKKFNIVKTIHATECLKDLSALKGIEVVFLSGVHSHDRNIVLKHCLYNGIDVYIIPRVGDVILRGSKTVPMFHLPVWRASRYSPSPFYLFAKRIIDIVVSAVAILITSPIFIIAAFAIKIYDRGPVFYLQNRLTKDGKEFKIIKFRSMCVDAEKDGVARLSSGDKDSRITPVGKIIRKVRIDELPQLFNIFLGQLSIVGPRPERPEIAEQYCKEMPEFSLRLQAKAGLTGYAQVYGQYNTSPYDKLQMDLMYISKPSLLEDLRICFATIKILFMSDSTEGIDEGQTTAMTDTPDNKQ